MKRPWLFRIGAALLVTACLAGIAYSASRVEAGTTSVRISAPASVAPGQTFSADIIATPGSALSGMQFDLSYNASLLTFVKVEEGALLSQSGANTYFQKGTASSGLVKAVSGVIITPGKNAFAEGVFARVTFTARSQNGTSPLTLTNVVLGDINGHAMQATVSSSQLTVNQPGSLAVTSPGAGASWQAGTSHNINWTYAGLTGNVKIELLKGASTVSTISAATAVIARARTWAVPANQTAGADYRIKVSSTTDAAVTDLSEYFSIGAPAPTVTTTAPATTTTTSPTSTTATPPSGTRLHINSITMTLVPYTVGSVSYVRAMASVTVVNENGALVSGARVYGVWSDTTADADNGLTGSTGKASLTSNMMERQDGLTFTFTVTDIVMTGYSYDSWADAEESGDITI